MAVVPVGKHFGSAVSDPCLVHVGIDLVLHGDLAELARCSEILTRVFVALIAIKNAQRDVEAKAGRVVNAGAVVIALERGIRSSIRIGQLYIGVRHAHSRLSCAVIGPCRQGPLLPISQAPRYGGWNKIPHDIEAAIGLGVAHQRLQLVAGLNQVHLRRAFIGFELGQLQIEPFEIKLPDVAGFKTIVVDLQHMAIIFQVVLRQLQGCLG